MKQRLKKKLTSRRGETLTETLCAILVVALSAAILAAMIGAASNMSLAAKTADAALYEALSKAETAEAGQELGSGSITVQVDGVNLPAPFSVDYYGEDGTLVSYREVSGG